MQFIILRLISELAFHEDGFDLEVAVQDHDIRQISRSESADLFKAERLRLIPGSGLDEVFQRKPRDLIDIAERIADLERASRKCAVGGKPCRAVLHDHGESAERGFPVRHSRRAHRIRDELDLFHVFQRKDQGNHIGTDMKLVADQFDENILAGESGADQSDVAMVKRRHLIAEMSQVLKSVLMGRLKLFESRGAVNTGRRNAFRQTFRGKLVAPGHFNRVGNLFHRENPGKAFDHLNIGLSHEIGVLRTETFRIDERAFQMDAGEFDAFDAVLDIICSRPERFRKLFFRKRKRRGKERRDTLFEFVDTDRRHGFIRGVAEINAGFSVTVNVDEPGNSHFAVDVDYFIRLRKRISFGEDLSDHVIFNKDGGAVQLHIRRDEVTVFEKHVH